MPVNSVNTNPAAALSVRNLGATNEGLDATRNRVATGLQVFNALTDASSFVIGEGASSELKSIAAVQQGIANGRGVGQVALAGATEVSNLLTDLRAKAISAASPGNSESQQALLEEDFRNAVGQVRAFIDNANFNGRNLLQAGANDLGVISDTEGGTLSLGAQDLETDVADALDAASLATPGDAASALGVIDSAIQRVGSALGGLGADVRALGAQDRFSTAISDAVQEGLGSIVDADLGREATRLQAQQAKQQLSILTLSIANAQPNILTAFTPAA
ncbi:MAG: flagellin [Rhodospirillaceae bacterium]|nr:flagellin [Rhodospirillaceae bacterium]